MMSMCRHDTAQEGEGLCVSVHQEEHVVKMMSKGAESAIIHGEPFP